MKILVTGGAGFIGSAVVRHIIQNTQDSVVNVDCLTYAGNLKLLLSVVNNVRYVFERANICYRAGLDRVFNSYYPDAVMHLVTKSNINLSCCFYCNQRDRYVPKRSSLQVKPIGFDTRLVQTCELMAYWDAFVTVSKWKGNVSVQHVTQR